MFGYFKNYAYLCIVKLKQVTFKNQNNYGKELCKNFNHKCRHQELER